MLREKIQQLKETLFKEQYTFEIDISKLDDIINRLKSIVDKVNVHEAGDKTFIVLMGKYQYYNFTLSIEVDKVKKEAVLELREISFLRYITIDELKSYREFINYVLTRVVKIISLLQSYR